MKRFVIGLVCLLSIVFTAGCADSAAKKRDEAYAKACAANMRVMNGAIEMYNMDNTPMLKDVSEDMVLEGGVIVKSGLLKQPIQKPTEKCKYIFTGDFSQVDVGVISCEAHGTVDEIVKKYAK